MKINEKDKKIILQYLNEGISLRKNMNESGQEKYIIRDSNIIYLFKILGYKIIFNGEKWIDIVEDFNARKESIF